MGTAMGGSQDASEDAARPSCNHLPALIKSSSLDDIALAGPTHRAEVANAPVLTAVTKIVTSVEGKDKVFRTLFFGFKLLRAATQRQMMPVQLLETALLDARRVFRLFREVEPLQTLIRHAASGKSKHPWIKACTLTQLAGLIGFLFTNHLVLLTKVKLLKLSPGRLRGFYGLCFLVMQSAGLLQDLYRMYLLRQLVDREQDYQQPFDVAAERCTELAGLDVAKAHHLQERRARLVAFRIEISASMAKHILDHVLAINLIRGASGKIQWNNGVVGSVGTATSLIQLWQLWRTCRSGVPLQQRVAVENAVESVA